MALRSYLKLLALVALASAMTIAVIIVNLQTRDMRVRLGDLIEAIERPFSVEFPLEQVASQVEEISSRWVGTHESVVLLFWSESTQDKGRTVVGWSKLIERLEGFDTPVWLLTFDTVDSLEIRRLLQESKVPMRISRVRDSVILTLRTGIRHVPATVVLNEGLLGFFCLGQLDSAEIEQAASAVGEGVPSRPFVFPKKTPKITRIAAK